MNTFVCFFSYLFTRTVDLPTTVENTISIKACLDYMICRADFVMYDFSVYTGINESYVIFLSLHPPAIPPPHTHTFIHE